MARVQGERGRDVAGAGARAARPREGGAGPDVVGERAPRLPLPASFYDRPVLDVAPDLLGCVVVHGETAGVIVETEAYHFSEPACHAYVGLTPRTSVIFGPPGIAYVYRSYGIHALLNAVCEPDGVGAAVLIRALEPIEGIGLMRERRGDAPLTNGPGKLTQALGIELTENATSLIDGPIRILEGPRRPYVTGPRIGITKAADLPWRFCATGSRDVSKPWPPGLNPGPRRPGQI